MLSKHQFCPAVIVEMNFSIIANISTEWSEGGWCKIVFIAFRDIFLMKIPHVLLHQEQPGGGQGARCRARGSGVTLHRASDPDPHAGNICLR